MRSRADNGLRGEMVRRLKPLGFIMDCVESGGTVGGLPDATWLHAESGRAGWCECKATEGWAVKFRPHQVSWLARRARAAHADPVTVAVRASGVGSGLGAGDSMWLLRGACAPLLAAEGLERCCAQAPDLLLGRWAGPPKLWDWHAVAACLLAR